MLQDIPEDVILSVAKNLAFNVVRTFKFAFVKVGATLVAQTILKTK